MKNVKPADSEEITYAMPRPKSALYNFFFGLGDREIQRKLVDPFKDQTAKTTAGVGSVRTKDGAKKDAAKTNAAKTAQAQAQAKAKAHAQALAATRAKAAAQAAAKKKAEVKVNVIAKDENRIGTSADGADRSAQTQGVGNANNNRRNNNGETTPDDGVQDKMSASEWRTLVLGQPTKENVAKLVAAFNEKQVDASTLYSIMDELAQNPNPQVQGQALVIAQQIPSLRSFTVVSNHYEKFDANVKRSADAYFLSYMQGSRLGILAMALQSNDNALVFRAAQVMVAGLQMTGGNAAGNSQGRLGRGVVGTSAPTRSNYSQFIPLFQNLQKNPDASISGLAQNALSQLQALSNT